MKHIYSNFIVRLKIIPILITMMVGVSACNSSVDDPDISFYYWKTVFRLSDLEKRAVKENKVKNLYVRYFDIDINPNNQKPFPLSPIVFEQKIEGLNVIPVVYIKNKVMLQQNSDMKNLAEKVFDYIEQINKKAGLACNEIQIDCDWTINSRINYFKFIEFFKSLSKKRLSATIRLHQVKYYFKTKIPNVDRGVLMYYNMGSIAADSLNSIYEKSIAENYINSLSNYPLELDVALPIYAWGVQIRNNKVINLLNKVTINSFSNDTNFITGNNHFFVVKYPTIKFGYYFKQNDKIKMEFISFNDLIEMADDLGKKMKKKPREIIFYDLDSTNLNNYGNENQVFKKIVSHF